MAASARDQHTVDRERRPKGYEEAYAEAPPEEGVRQAGSIAPGTKRTKALSTISMIMIETVAAASASANSGSISSNASGAPSNAWFGAFGRRAQRRADDADRTNHVALRLGHSHMRVLRGVARASYADGEEEIVTEHRRTTTEEAKRVGDEIGVDWSRFDLEQFRAGMDVEFEHGAHDPQTDVTGDDPIITGKIALAHMKEFPDYYERLERMEREAEREWAEKS